MNRPVMTTVVFQRESHKWSLESHKWVGRSSQVNFGASVDVGQIFGQHMLGIFIGTCRVAVNQTLTLKAPS